MALPLPEGEGWGEGEGISLSFTALFSAVGSGLDSASKVVPDALREHQEHEAAREAALLHELTVHAPAREPRSAEWAKICEAQRQARAEMRGET